MKRREEKRREEKRREEKRRRNDSLSPFLERVIFYLMANLIRECFKSKIYFLIIVAPKQS